MPAAAAAAVLAAPLAGRCAYAASRLRTPVRRAAASVVPRAMPFRARCGGAVAPASSARRRAARGSSRAVTARASADDEIYRVMSANQEVSVVAVVGTKVVADAVSRHKTAPTATAALGRTMLSALLLGVFKGDDETVQITFKGDGPIGTIMAISDNRGMVKGMCANPSADPPLRPDGKLNVGAAVGKGILSVSRAHPDWKQPFTGMVNIVTGEIAEDVATYMLESEQVTSAIAVGVSLDRALEIRSAGGYMVQVLPFASEETVSALEKSIAALPSTTDMIADGWDARTIAAKVLGDLGVIEDTASRSTPSYGPCDLDDLRTRMMRALASMGRAEVESIIKEQGVVEMTCEFCKDTIVFTEQELLSAKDEI